jgi:F-type H+-transporting ATPase subunit epsilon
LKVNIKSVFGDHVNQEVDYVVVKYQDGEIAILKDHIPILLSIEEGYIRLQSEAEVLMCYILQGFLEFSNNTLTVAAYDISVSKTLEEAKEALLADKKVREQQAKEENVDFSKLERDLYNYLKASKAGKL